MRIWDLHPGYLNRQSLLGEHRELHGVVAIIRDRKKGYSRHPETLRWVGHGWALKQRHRLLVAEMELRGYVDRSPVRLRSNPGVWPEKWIDPPEEQIRLLGEKYHSREPGRIPLPCNAQQFWAQHKYSVMARDIGAYRAIGQQVTTREGSRDLAAVSLEVLRILRNPPEPRLIENVLLHLWGYVSRFAAISGEELEAMKSRALLEEIQRLALSRDVRYLIESTALSELDAWER